MRRRQVLQTSAGALALAGFGGVAGATGNDAQYAPMGEVSFEGGASEIARANGGDHAISAVGNGFIVTDVSDPASPSIVAEERELLPDHENGPMVAIADVKVDGDRLLVSGPNGPTQSARPQAALLYDISDPTAPEQLDVVEVEHPIHNSFYADGHAYLTVSDFSYEGFKIFDTSDDAFERVGRWSIIEDAAEWSDVHGYLRSCHDLYVQDDVAYLAQWDAGTFIVDVSDKTSPEILGHAGGLPAEELAAVTQDSLAVIGTGPPGNAHYVQPNDDASLLFVGSESWDATPDDDRRGASGIEIFDISDPANPESLSYLKAPGSDDESRQGTFTTSHNFDVTGDRLYSSWYYGGVMIHDVSDPANPERLSWWRDPEQTQFWGAKVGVEGEFFLASNMQGSVFTFPDEAGEMSDPPGAFTPPEETTRVTEVEWAQYQASETTTTPPTTAEPTTAEPTTAAPTAEPTTAESTSAPTTAADDDGTATDDSGGSPGFGALAAAGGIGLGAARLLANRDDERDE